MYRFQGLYCEINSGFSTQILMLYKDKTFKKVFTFKLIYFKQLKINHITVALQVIQAP